MSSDIAEDPVVRRWTIRAVWIAAAAILLLGGYFYGSTVGYRRNFKRMNESQVVSMIGKPYSDSRQGTEVAPKEFTLGWSYSIGLKLILTFKNGVVVGQEYGSR
ncbi:MAG: hypothetical protein HY293_05595 [Planctomycetes bacterium]|nr:hypothetical protein [Planctomycetota bacterium]